MCIRDRDQVKEVLDKNQAALSEFAHHLGCLSNRMKTVSYTHLDVYKRQVFALLLNKIGSLNTASTDTIISVFSSCSVAIGLALSLIHI